MLLFVGLGNPGGKYAKNRHNIGFMAVDRLAVDHGFGPWKSKFQGVYSEGRFGSEKVMLLKPETFMNKSGQSVGEAMRFFKLEPEDVVVFHDELDLAPGKVRVKQGGGHAGHNGLRSIHGHIGDTYERVRLGIGHPGHKDKVASHVLNDFAKADSDWLEDVMRGVSDGAADLAAGRNDRFLNAVSLRTAPPRSSKSVSSPMSGSQARADRRADMSAKPHASAQAKPPPSAPSKTEPDDTRNPLQKLIDKFR